MSDVSEIVDVGSTSNHGAIVAVPPLPRCTVRVRAAVAGDLPFIDALQKMHGHMVGFFRLPQLEKEIEAGNILMAEEIGIKASRDQGIKGQNVPNQPSVPGCRPHDASMPQSIQIGYIFFKDQYMKRDDVGIVYQLNVMPLRHRHLVGATLVKAAFEKAAYGCKLFCCWCAQDIQANWFWESIGFVPLAFRTGSRAKQRTHIFWQRRVRDNDDVTPYWYPAKTDNGAVAEERLVLPIPPGTHWRDAKPMVLPGLPQQMPELPLQLPGGQPLRTRPEKPKLSRNQRAAIMRSQSKHMGGTPLGKKAVIRGGRIKYVDRPDYVAELDAPDELMAEPKVKREKKPRQKVDPEHAKAARELRDRYLEQVNADRLLPGAVGKWDVSRQLETPPAKLEPAKLLNAA